MGKTREENSCCGSSGVRIRLVPQISSTPALHQKKLGLRFIFNHSLGLVKSTPSFPRKFYRQRRPFSCDNRLYPFILSDMGKRLIAEKGKSTLGFGGECGSCGSSLLNKNSSASFSHHFLPGLGRIEQAIADTYKIMLSKVASAYLSVGFARH